MHYTFFLKRLRTSFTVLSAVLIAVIANADDISGNYSQSPDGPVTLKIEQTGETFTVSRLEGSEWSEPAELTDVSSDPEVQTVPIVPAFLSAHRIESYIFFHLSPDSTFGGQSFPSEYLFYPAGPAYKVE